MDYQADKEKRNQLIDKICLIKDTHRYALDKWDIDALNEACYFIKHGEFEDER